MTLNFSDLQLNEKILQAIQDAGYKTPTPIQQQAIPQIINGKDVIGIAQTGTGKTASFTLPMIQRLSQGRARARMPRSVIITPTRELAMQINENILIYSKYCSLQTALLIGGTSYGKQDIIIQRGVDILICTPGRLLDHIENGKLLLNGTEVLVIDEADRMLDMGFIPDVKKILQRTPVTRQTLLFSATLNKEIEKLIHQFLFNPHVIKIEKTINAAKTIEQFSLHLPNNNDKLKRYLLRNIILKQDYQSIIIFCNRKKTVDIVAKSLCIHKLHALPIHGDMAQEERISTLNKFRSGDNKILVASDVAARGLDVPFCSHVFNFDTPANPDDYIHRIGRTGRAGRSGKSYVFITPTDEENFQQILSHIGEKKLKALDVNDFLQNIDKHLLSNTDNNKANYNQKNSKKPYKKTFSNNKRTESLHTESSKNPPAKHPRTESSYPKSSYTNDSYQKPSHTELNNYNKTNDEYNKNKDKNITSNEKENKSNSTSDSTFKHIPSFLKKPLP